MELKNIPSIQELVTPGWVSEKLRSAGITKTAIVTVVKFDPIGVGEGFTGEVGRIFLAYDTHEPGLPKSVIIKSPNLLPELRTNMMNLYVREYLFFTEAAAETPLKLPRLYFGEVDIDAEKALLLFEDLAPAKAIGLHVEEEATIRLALDQLARLHAAWWDHPKLKAFDWLPSIDHGLNEIFNVFPQFWEKFKSRQAEHLSVEIINIGNTMQSRIRKIRSELARQPQTLLHGDSHGNNLLQRVNPKNSDLYLIDWQVCRRGRAMRDVAQFITLTISLEDRRSMEDELLQYYHQRLQNYGVRMYSFEEAVADYKISLLDLFYFVIVISQFLDFSSQDQMLEIAIKRICEIVLDHHGA